jgi:Trk K+ transport system NAD-binding subunit
MRRPLIALIVVYAIATFVLTLIPGIDPDGNPWKMTVFQAFYFVSFMGSTIGFGEIPYPFTDGQRYWVLICIYTSVVVWLYTIGSMLTLIQEGTFRQSVVSQQFSRSIRKLKAPFFIICGYGDTGITLTKGLTDLGYTVVVLDKSDEDIKAIPLGNFKAPVYSLTADFTIPETLIRAGIKKRKYCRGIIALSPDDHTNLKVAVATKSLQKDLLTVTRAEDDNEIANLRSFNTDVIINSHELFAERLVASMNNPTAEAIARWLINQQQVELEKIDIPEDDEDEDLEGGEEIENKKPPKKTIDSSTHVVPSSGRWIICGYGKFGRTLKSYMDEQQVETIIIEESDKQTDLPEDYIEGKGTEAKTLEKAGIYEAAGLIAGTKDDANNLSVLLTAKTMNDKLFTVGRLNEQNNMLLYSSAEPNMILRNRQLMSDAILTRITRPMVTRFLRELPKLSAKRTRKLYSRIALLTAGERPITWAIKVTEEDAPAITKTIESGHSIQLKQLLCNPLSGFAGRSCCLMIRRAGHLEIMPDEDIELHVNDEILLCGTQSESRYTKWQTHNIELLENNIFEQRHIIPLLRWLKRRKHEKNTTS